MVCSPQIGFASFENEVPTSLHESAETYLPHTPHTRAHHRHLRGEAGAFFVSKIVPFLNPKRVCQAAAAVAAAGVKERQ